MNVPFLIGVRFMMSKHTSGFLSFVTWVSVVGLMLGVMALVTVVSVMNGFDSQLKHRILGAAPHVVLSEPVQEDPDLLVSAPFLRFQGMILGAESRLVSIYGVEPESEAEVSVIGQHMIDGDLEVLSPGSNQVIMGATLAARLGLWPGQTATLMIPVASSGGRNVTPKIAQVQVGGLFRLDSEIDFGLLLMHVEDLQRIAGADQVNYRGTLRDVFAVGAFQQRHHPSILSTWAQDYGDFFATVRMEKIMMFLLLTLIVMIAAFNTVSGLSMMVKEKLPEIAVLRTMGLTGSDITLAFIVQGSLVGLGGVLLGLIFGLPLAFYVGDIVGFFEDMLGGRMLAGTYFDRVPSDIRLFDTVVIAVVATIIAIAATVYPAYRAGRVQPAEVLRGE